VGLLLVVIVTAAGADDGAAAPGLPGRLDEVATPRLRVIRGDQEYRNHDLIEWQLKNRPVYHVMVVSRPKGARGFVPVAKRWAVERSFAWLLRDRRHVRDFERLVASSEARIRLSGIHLMLRRLCPGSTRKEPPFRYRTAS
jgi:hypothetical protein